jgi:hypothetical protein
MTKSKPCIRRLFDKAERAVGEPLEDLVASKDYTDILLTLQKLRAAVDGAINDTASGVFEKTLNAVQIPTRSDVRRLNRQIVELATEVRALSAELQARPAVAPRKAKQQATVRSTKKQATPRKAPGAKQRAKSSVK